ncbi:MAG: M14 family zinc carboxypeptidase [Pyrinomonadaceae bacterium]
MIKNKSFFAPLRLCGIIFLFAISVLAQKIPEPKDVLGFTPGDDRKLASWAQTIEYFKRLDAASDRVNFEEIGKSTLGNPFVYATISTPANLKNLETYKQINAKLADPRLIKSDEKLANGLIKQGKTIVLITCGVHSNEVGSYLSSMLIAHKLASSNDAETQKILSDTIILLVPSLNPDGVDIIKNWYDKTLGTPFEGTEPPELYHKYVGHDDNRDWYAFTQIETQLTVEKIHNVWHPQIVHDIHQQGANGSRLFLPPYMQPVEPNVPKELVEGYTELGNYMADSMRKQGFQGITTDSTYDAWTPARAYSHYHGGVRILSETASAKLATPVTVKFEDLRGGLGYDARKESANFSPVWKGGEWHLRDITNYMTTAAFSLLKHSSDNRERWLSRFYAIGKEAVRPRKDGETFAYVLDDDSPYKYEFWRALKRAGVETENVGKFTYNGNTYGDFTTVIRMNQPYAAFAGAMIEQQKYPDLLDAKGQPIPPYDVTAHNLALLTGTKLTKIVAPYKFNKPPPLNGNGSGEGNGVGCSNTPQPRRLYRSQIASMDEGWTRWIFENYSYLVHKKNPCEGIYKSIIDKEIKSENFTDAKFIVFPDQSSNQILNGFPKGSMPDEYTGGIGKDGAANLRKFVEAGGTLVFLNRASSFAVEQFNLPVKDVTKGLERKDFYIPGSILRTEIDQTHPIAKGMPKDSIAWFENSPAFEIQTNPLALANNFRIIARYPSNPKDILLSGWALGAEKIVGKAALVEFTVGKGKIILFGFRPQYRGQSLATFPLLFNAISE